MTLRLNGSNSGYTEIDAAAAAGNNLVTLPTGTGTVPLMTLGTAQSSTSGTAIDFTSIPSWVKRVTVMFDQVSLSGTSAYLIQLGTSGGVVSTNYKSHTAFIQASAVGSLVSTSGFIIYGNLASDLLSGNEIIVLHSGNKWRAGGTLFIDSTTDYTIVSSGFVDLSGTLDRVRITTVNGTDTFDAGSINILYEG